MRHLTSAPVRGRRTLRPAPAGDAHVVEALERRLCLAVTFGPPISYPIPESGAAYHAEDVVVGDFNGDGRPDVVVGFYAAGPQFHNGAAVYLNSGAGTFAAPISVSADRIRGPVHVGMGDFHGNGFQDLAVAVGTFDDLRSTVVVVTGTGNGGFSGGASVVASSGPSINGIAAADFNRDGIDDLATANGFVTAIGNDDVSIVFGNHAGVVGLAHHVALPPGGDATALAVGDFDGNGRADLAVADSSGHISVLIGNGFGDFGIAPSIPVGNNRPTSIAVGDFNHDTKQDLAVTYGDANVVTILLGDGLGAFTPADPVSIVNFGTDSFSVVVGDFDGNGNQDLAVASYGNSYIEIFNGDGVGHFGSPIFLLPGAGTKPDSLAVADFNHDGKLDLACADDGSRALTVLLNTSPPADQTPPAAKLTYAPTITVAGHYYATLDVTYSDNVAVDASSLANSGVTVTGPNGYSSSYAVVATYVVNGTEVRGRYFIPWPASGRWDAAGNGAYVVSLNASQVKDTSGNFVAGGALGAFIVNIPSDSTPPQGTLTGAQPVSIGGGKTYHLAVTYTDNIAVYWGSTGGGIRVTAPGGAILAQGAAGASVPDGSPMTLDYGFTPPGGTWDPTDNGTYTVSLLANQVTDTSGNAAAGKTLGTFQVNVVTGTASISAAFYNDDNANGVHDAGEGSQGYRQAYLDLNNDGAADGGDPALIDIAGNLSVTFSGLPPGTYVLRPFVDSGGKFGERLTDPQAGYYSVTLTAGQSVSRTFGITSLPGVLGATFVYQSSPHSLRIAFSEEVSGSLSLDDLTVVALPSGQAISPSGYHYESATETGVFTFAGVLPDGNYRATLHAAGVTDFSGNPLTADYVADFFALAGDADHDRSVDFKDLVVLAQHYSMMGMAFDRGDFNYDGKVDFGDLVILAQRYNTVLPPSPARPVGGSLLFAARATSDKSEASVFNLVRPMRPNRAQHPVSLRRTLRR